MKHNFYTTLHAYHKGKLVYTKKGWPGLELEKGYFRPRTAAYNISHNLMGINEFEKEYDPYDGLEYDKFVITIKIKE